MSLPAMAQEQGASFENFLLSSPSIVSPSQYYQVKGGRFEALAGVIKSTDTDKDTDTDTDRNGTQLGAGYAQALSSQLVLGAHVKYASDTRDVTPDDLETTATEIRPSVAFSVSPLFTLGASININTGKLEQGSASESVSYNTFTLGGTVHQELLEASLAFTTSAEDDEKPWNRSPQTITVHGRYKFMPVLALGLRYEQADWPGVQASGEQPKDETESSYAVILESAVSDNSRVEVAFISTSNSIGTDGDDTTEIFLGGGFDLTPNMELGGQIRFNSGESDSTKSSGTDFALTLSMMN
ncbi:MAG TPA: porin [Oligoflexus sp.]|uniref:porin n=1 Tax=Oligoflexus sp. TaxID=1971216 RepID=UPI002D7EA50F|nr:porin [Oligoflexus sp.]HET9237309.1 porin [Oligoflexus sp.]